VNFCKDFPSKVNIIEYNTVEGDDFEKTDEFTTNKFALFLEKNGVTANIRKSRGKDIDAACGQLANKS